MNSRAKRYQRLLRQVARELDEKPNTEMVKHVSTLRLMRENLQIRLLEGHHVDPGDILKIDEALKQYLPQGKPLSVRLDIVEGVSICPKCGWKGKTADLPPPPDPEPPPAPTQPPSPERADEAASADAPPSASAPAAGPSNVVPMPRRGVSVSAFHDQPGVPLKKLQASVDGDGKPIHNSGVGTLCW
jgi:hypothetical protein